jgi:hypothetical protein
LGATATRQHGGAVRLVRGNGLSVRQFIKIDTPSPYWFSNLNKYLWTAFGIHLADE